MNEASYDVLLERLDGNGRTPSRVVDLVLAAADGAEALDALLAGGAAPQARKSDRSDLAGEPARVYLEQIAVQNFRGIGPQARLPLAVGPGLTLVVGRNGSGKSSFAEGLELLLTGTNLRWAEKTKVWQEGWRNLHGEGSTMVSARFRADGEAEPLELEREWPEGASLSGGGGVVVKGPRTSWDGLAWDAPLEQFRPLLSYNELGTMFSERAAALYEALSAVLGLQDFDELAATLRGVRLEREKSGKLEKTERKQVLGKLGASDDPRARQVETLLAPRAPDLDAIDAVVLEAPEEADGGLCGASPVSPFRRAEISVAPGASSHNASVASNSSRPRTPSGSMRSPVSSPRRWPTTSGTATSRRAPSAAPKASWTRDGRCACRPTSSDSAARPASSEPRVPRWKRQTSAQRPLSGGSTARATAGGGRGTRGR